MNAIFQEHIRNTVECYVDDIAVKSRNKGDHLTDLRRVFDILPAHQLKMNPTKSILGVASDKFFEFVITSKEIHLDLENLCHPRDATSEKSQRTQRSTGMISVHLGIYIKSLRVLPTLHQIDEEGSLIHLGQCLPRSI